MKYQWTRASDGMIPPNAFRGGYDDKNELYVARARNPKDGLLTAGKATPSGCTISYGGVEIGIKDYEVLTVTPEQRKNFVWEFCKNGTIPGYAVSTDRDLYVARFAHNSSIILGKIMYGFGGAHCPFSGIEIYKKQYEVLCYYG